MRQNNKYEGLVELAFRVYGKERANIEMDFIKSEHVKLVSNLLHLRDMSDEELSLVWDAVNIYFYNLMAVLDENDKLVGWKQSEDFQFWRDSDSAFKAVINQEAVSRRKAAKPKVQKPRREKKTYIVWVSEQDGRRHMTIKGAVLSAQVEAIRAKFGNLEKRKLEYKYRVTIDI